MKYKLPQQQSTLRVQLRGPDSQEQTRWSYCCDQVKLQLFFAAFALTCTQRADPPATLRLCVRRRCRDVLPMGRQSSLQVSLHTYRAVSKLVGIGCETFV